MQSAETQLASVTTASATARAFLRETLETWELDGLGHVTELLTSELVSNAVRHGGSPITLRAVRHRSRLRIEVEDAAPATPRLQDPEPAEPGGRGILIVDTLADAWGTDVREDGKTVWFELDVPAPTAGHHSDH